jgi:3-hydroxybutyrate dehydrogenase
MKTALITGSTSGIGLEIAKKLASLSFNIILNGFGDKLEIENIANSIASEYKVKVKHHPANLANKNEIIDMIKFAEQEFSQIDVLVNNAGIQFVSPITEFPDEKWEQVIDINLNACFFTIKYCLPFMIKNNFGRIINISSTHGKVASVNKSAYVASKHGLIGLTKVVALENAGKNITCNAICPGWVHTPLVQKQIDDIAKRDNISNQAATEKLLSEKEPSKKFTKPSDIASMIAFLVGESADNITGSSFVMDGGWTAQ